MRGAERSTARSLSVSGTLSRARGRGALRHLGVEPFQDASGEPGVPAGRRDQHGHRRSGAAAIRKAR